MLWLKVAAVQVVAKAAEEMEEPKEAPPEVADRPRTPGREEIGRAPRAINQAVAGEMQCPRAEANNL